MQKKNFFLYALILNNFLLFSIDERTLTKNETAIEITYRELIKGNFVIRNEWATFDKITGEYSAAFFVMHLHLPDEDFGYKYDKPKQCFEKLRKKYEQSISIKEEDRQTIQTRPENKVDNSNKSQNKKKKKKKHSNKNRNRKYQIGVAFFR